MSELRESVKEIILVNIDGMSSDEAKYYIENDARCNTGSVSGLIYYSETIKFFDDNEEEILDLAREYEFDLKPTELGMTGYKNNMAWFAFDVLVDEVFEGMK